MSRNIPSDVECMRFLKEAGCRRRVIVHCCTVRAVAEQMMKGIKGADEDLVIAGALMHDIGRAVDHSILHASIGAEMARKLNLPEELVEIIKKHTGAGLDSRDVEDYGLPPGDYIPRTLEEKIVSHADNLVHDDQVVGHGYSAEKLRTKGFERGAARMEALHAELSELYGQDLDTIAGIIGEYPVLKGITR